MLEKSKIDIENDFTEEEVAAIAPKPLSLEEQVAVKYRGGLPVLQIGREHNISTGRVYDILNRKGEPLRQGRSLQSKSAARLLTMTAMQKQNLINDYLDGMMLKTIFDKYKINKHGTYTILDEQNVPRRDKGDTPRHHHNNSNRQSRKEVAATSQEPVTETDEVIEVKRVGNDLHVIVKNQHQPIDRILLNIGVNI